MKELAKTYDPKSFEKRIYDDWEKSGDFQAGRDPAKKPYTIVIPPPNITGQLHMGHAYDQSIQDVLTRWRRMQGYSALWLPGTDHASIATEVKVSDEIYRTEGKTKSEIGREEFLKRSWQWKDIYGGKITEQQRRLGNSCDWDRERFTMDEGCNKAVVEFFVRLYEKGLIYKGSRLINWCPTCATSLSDAEVEHIEQGASADTEVEQEKNQGKYWYIRYPAEDGGDGGEGITVATSRPETMFGDVCIAVNPDDERYCSMVGKNVLLPITEKVLPVIADPYPDPEKGTGAVKITPAHDQNDFEVGERHKLPQPVCIGFDAKMTPEAGQYEGLDRFVCRERWVEALEAGGFVVKTEDVDVPVGTCYRCGTIIEPMISEQWFVSMKELAKPAIEAIDEGTLKIVPQRFTKTYLHWLENIRDWCISRQLWWGHRIPAWYCDCGEVIVARSVPNECPKCGIPGDELMQDDDVLDTWFSSGLWPFSTLGWPEETPDLKFFFPTSVLVTAYDILFFWVIRMVFSSFEMMGRSPFNYAVIHGIVRDEHGRKMSKSLGNGVDPLEIIDIYGADALRLYLLGGSAVGNDMRFKVKDVEFTRNFANKLWNASRFVLMNIGGANPGREPSNTSIPAPYNSYENLCMNDLHDEDRWILEAVDKVAAEVTENLEKFEISVAVQKIHDLIRDDFCDWYIELVKARLYGDDEESKASCQAVLVSVLSDCLRLLHPLMPFITEEIWSYLGKPVKLILDKWPEPKGFTEADEFSDSAKKIETAKDIIKAVRNIRAEAGAAPSRKIPILIKTDPGAYAEETTPHVMNLAGVSEVRLIDDVSDIPDKASSAVLDGMVIFVPLEDLVDSVAENVRLDKERVRLESEVARLEEKLSNESFVSKAPAEIVEAERTKLESAKEALEKVEARIAQTTTPEV